MADSAAEVKSTARAFAVFLVDFVAALATLSLLSKDTSFSEALQFPADLNPHLQAVLQLSIAQPIV
jgi:hypothetical protein